MRKKGKLAHTAEFSDLSVLDDPHWTIIGIEEQVSLRTVCEQHIPRQAIKTVR